MRTKEWYKENRWRLAHGLPERKPGLAPYIGELQEQLAWMDKWFQYMRNRILMGRFRYGPFSNKVKYDYISAIKKKIELYEKSGNLENLVDAANYCLLELKKPTREGVYFEAQDDSEHAKIIP